MLAEACNALWAMSALRVAVEHGMLAAMMSGPRTVDALAGEARQDPPITTRVLDVLTAYDLVAREGDAFSLTIAGRKLAARGDALRADIAVTFGQTRALVEEARRGTLTPGWRHVDPEVIRSQAILSHAMTMGMMRPLTEAWPEVGALFSREGAVFLDVGVGGAGASVAFCKLFPKLRVVGIDPLPAALMEARANVAANGLTDRIELRAQRGDELTEEHAFDIAFVPAKFMDDSGFERTLAKLARALKPDGCILTAGFGEVADPHDNAVSKLRCELWGAGPRTAEAVKTMLVRAGFAFVRIGPAMSTMVPILARRHSA